MGCYVTERGLGQWAEIVSGVISAGSQYLSRDINKDIANAQLELAKINAQTVAEKLRAETAQTALQAQAAQAQAGSGVGTALGIGAGVLVAGGLVAYMLLKKRRR